MRDSIESPNPLLGRFVLASNAAEFGLPILAAVIACTIWLFYGPSVQARVPVVLVFASLTLLIPTKVASMITLQRIVGVYLFCVPVNQVTPLYLTLTISTMDVKISYSAVILALCIAGYFAGKTHGEGWLSCKTEPLDVSKSWLLAAVVVLAHMAFLTLALRVYYGYGYETNPGVLGHIVLFVLLFPVLWNNLGRRPFRLSIGSVFTTHYVLISIIRS